MKLGPPLTVPPRPNTSGLSDFGGRWPGGADGNDNEPLPEMLALPVIDCSPVNCIGRRKLARTTLRSIVCSCTCSACKLKSTARPEKSSTTEHPTNAATRNDTAARTQPHITPRMISPPKQRNETLET